jgi:hypothetical protein
VCIRDNAAKLMWEAKTDDNGLRDKDWTYKVGTAALGTANDPAVTNACKGLTLCDTTSYIAEVNKGAGLCGKTTWRLPALTAADIAGTTATPAGEFSAIRDPNVATGLAIRSEFLPNTATFQQTVNGQIQEGYCTSKGDTGISFSGNGYPYAVSGNQCSIRLVAPSP